MPIPEIIRITSDHNTSQRPGGIDYIAIHYTAGFDSRRGKARDNAYYYAQTTEKASADFFVDDAEIVQYNPAPEKRYCWAVGAASPDKSQGGGSLWGKARNANVVNVEICSRHTKGKGDYPPNDPGYSFSPEAVANAIELVRYLMREYGVSKNRVIRHFDVTGKICPGIIGWNEPSGSIASWQVFKKRLAAADPEPEPERYNAVYECPSWAKDTVRKLCDKGYLQGNGGPVDVNGRPADLDLSLDMLRLLVVNDRAGCYGA